MNNDIRIAVDAPDHPKIKKLRSRLTDSSFLYLFYLWRHTARYCPDGKLKGMDKEDIELASEWPGERGIFVDTLIELRLLEEKNNEYIIHDWKDWNPYAANAPKRKQAAKKAATIKWERKYKGMRHAQKRNADLKKGNAPSPSPVPFPVPNTKDLFTEQPVNVVSFDDFWKVWPKKKSKDPALKSWNKIKPQEYSKIIEAVKAQIKSGDINTRDIQFCPLPSTWLNQKRWMDELTTPSVQQRPITPPRRSQDGWLIYPPDGGPRSLCNKHKISMPAGQKCPECEAQNARS